MRNPGGRFVLGKLGNGYGASSLDRLALIDTLRAIAILAVITVHSGGAVEALLTNQHRVPLPVVIDITSMGRFGVQLFFVLSGFLISFLYESPSVEPFSKWRRSYLAKRVARIYPLWILFLSIYVVLLFTPLSQLSSLKSLASGSDQLSTLLIAVSLTIVFAQWLVPNFWNNVIPGGWSIQVEVFHYLLFLLLKGKSNSRLLWCLASIQALGAISYFLTLVPSEEARNVGEAILRYGICNSSIFFIAGIFVSRHLNKGQIGLEGNQWQGAIAPGLATASLICLTPGSLSTVIPQFGFLLFAFFFALLLNSIRRLKTVLKSIAKYSYFMYFAHFLVLAVLLSWVKNLIFFDNDNVGVVMVTALAVFASLAAVTSWALGWLSYRLIERPILSFAHKF